MQASKDNGPKPLRQRTLPTAIELADYYHLLPEPEDTRPLSARKRPPRAEPDPWMAGVDGAPPAEAPPAAAPVPARGAPLPDLGLVAAQSKAVPADFGAGAEPHLAAWTSTSPAALEHAIAAVEARRGNVDWSEPAQFPRPSRGRGDRGGGRADRGGGRGGGRGRGGARSDRDGGRGHRGRAEPFGAGRGGSGRGGRSGGQRSATGHEVWGQGRSDVAAAPQRSQPWGQERGPGAAAGRGPPPREAGAPSQQRPSAQEPEEGAWPSIRRRRPARVGGSKVAGLPPGMKVAKGDKVAKRDKVSGLPPGMKVHKAAVDEE